MNAVMNLDYESFIASKGFADVPTGFDCHIPIGVLSDFQAFCVQWALKRGRAGLFEDTGLGKMRQELVWSSEVCKHTGGDAIIVSPLCPVDQIVDEAKKIGIKIKYCRNADEVESGITITNYEMLHAFGLSRFVSVALDESDCIKGEGVTHDFLIEAFRETPYKLVLTATPSPNDLTEIGPQAEFLGVMTKSEMLATFFTHDGKDTANWRLKGHGRAKFWEWMASWAICIRNPADLGFDGSRYILPELHVHEHVVDGGEIQSDEQIEMFHRPATELSSRRVAKKNSIDYRIELAANLANKSDESVLVWCHLNEESERLTKAIPDAVEITGSMKSSQKVENVHAFTRGDARVLVSKPSICGAGMNWQHCRIMVFGGMNDSFKDFYQAVRRCWRFGQSREVHVHVIVAETEGAVRENIRQKQQQADEMAAEMRPYMLELPRKLIQGATHGTEAYRPNVPLALPAWIYDNVERV